MVDLDLLVRVYTNAKTAAENSPSAANQDAEKLALLAVYDFGYENGQNRG